MTFLHYPEAIYATDVIFQQTNHSRGRIKKRKTDFSGKNHFYVYITEFSVLPIGLAIGHTASKPGIFADIEMFRENISWHVSITNKSADDEKSQITGKCPKHLLQIGPYLLTKDILAWKMIYVLLIRHESQEIYGCMLLSVQEKSSDRVIIDNYFGRLYSLNLFGSKWMWSIYDFS